MNSIADDDDSEIDDYRDSPLADGILSDGPFGGRCSGEQWGLTQQQNLCNFSLYLSGADGSNRGSGSS